MVLIGGQAIPRGGQLSVDPVGEGETMGFRVAASGANARMPQAVPALLSGDPNGHAVDAHAIQPFYTGMLARSCGLAIALASEGNAIVVTAR
jgi:histidine phosphotransferase ChpT